MFSDELVATVVGLERLPLSRHQAPAGAPPAAAKSWLLLAAVAGLLLAVRAAAEVAPVGEVAVGEVAVVASLAALIAATVAAVVPFSQHRRHGSIQGRGRPRERQSHAEIHRRLRSSNKVSSACI